MEYVRERKRCEEVHYDLVFAWKDDPGAGFSFECDKDGRVDTDKLQPLALENYNRCLSGQIDVECTGVRRWVQHWVEPAVILCVNCDCEVELWSNTNTCEKCGRDYNMSGQMLAPREFWGEETGEHWTECL